VKNTGYGQAVQITFKELYGVDDLNAKTVVQIQDAYEKTRRTGFYRHIISELSNIESCQVNSLEEMPFRESAMPQLLMQDISIVRMFGLPKIEQLSEPTGIKVRTIEAWYQVIDWWFERYGQYAVAVKTQHAYGRDIDYSAEKVADSHIKAIFAKVLNQEKLPAEEQKCIEDHLFWYAVRKSTEMGLPVKVHTGYYAGHDRMPLARLLKNAGSATELCKASPETKFVFMHICYPYYEEILSVAKHYANAHIDMCWSWLINPVAAKDFLKKYLVTAPANKIVTFGGDYIPVEPVIGHAAIARKGIALALSELVQEGWYTMDAAMAMVDELMYGNADRIFNLKQKSQNLKKAPWAKSG
jgi:predicted TIM-barrel fold metal-dependent hydrolase